MCYVDVSVTIIKNLIQSTKIEWWDILKSNENSLSITHGFFLQHSE